MTLEELNKANNLRDELFRLADIVAMLGRTVREHEKNLDNPKYKRILRFLNYRRRQNEEEKAEIILFNGLSIHGIEIPVDQETCKQILEIFEAKLHQKQAEFESIGRYDNGKT